MFLSSIQGPAEIEAVNLDFIAKSLAPLGFTFQKRKNKDLESGFYISSFSIEKNGLVMASFIIRLDKNIFVCAGYINGKLIQQKQVRFENDIPQAFQTIFDSNKVKPEDELFRFDLQLQKVRKNAQKIQQGNNNYASFTQEVKTSAEYKIIKDMQKLAYEKLVADTQKSMQDKKTIDAQNESLIDSLLRIESNKQLLQTAIISFEQELQYLQNAKDRISQQLTQKQAASIELNIHNLNEVSFSQYLKNLTEKKQLELKLKCLTK